MEIRWGSVSGITASEWSGYDRKSTWRQLSRRAVRRRFQWYCDGERYRKIKTFTQNEDVMTILSDGKDQGTEVILYLPIKEREKTDV